MRDVEIKRIYDEPAHADGHRVLVDRLWPRGITKERAHLDEWAKDIAPSTELRKWFSHDPKRMGEFRLRADPSASASHFSASIASLSTIAWLIFGSCAA